MTAREALGWAATRLAGAGQDDRRVATVLLQAAGQMDDATLLLTLDQPLQESALAAFQGWVERAAVGEPAQYILGQWDFFGRAFKTDRRALIPRPETERLVEEALAAIPADSSADVIDVGCGTGCIGVSIKLERPNARVTLADISLDALALAGENAAALHADVAFHSADMREPLPDGPYDVIVSNPPYISAADMAGLPRNVREQEPALALDGGEDGLMFVRALADRAGDSLKPGGSLFIEIGYDQAKTAVAIMKAAGMDARAVPDYGGILRVIAARKGI